MPTPIALTVNGVTVAKSAQCSGEDVAIDEFDATLTRETLKAIGKKNRFLRRPLLYDYEFPLKGSRVSRIDSSRSSGKAAVGAIAGTLIAGPLGLIAGAALGGRKKHLLLIQHKAPGWDAALVFEASTSELSTFASVGLLTE